MEGSGCGYHRVDTPNCPLVLVIHHNRPERQEGRMGEREDGRERRERERERERGREEGRKRERDKCELIFANLLT